MVEVIKNLKFPINFLGTLEAFLEFDVLVFYFTDLAPMLLDKCGKRPSHLLHAFVRRLLQLPSLALRKVLRLLDLRPEPCHLNFNLWSLFYWERSGDENNEIVKKRILASLLTNSSQSCVFSVQLAVSAGHQSLNQLQAFSHTFWVHFRIFLTIMLYNLI